MRIIKITYIGSNGEREFEILIPMGNCGLVHVAEMLEALLLGKLRSDDWEVSINIPLSSIIWQNIVG